MMPIDILTVDNQRIIEAVARNNHTHRDHVLAAMFAAAATMLGKRVQTRIESYTNYAQLWVAVVGYTSEAKSPAMRFLFRPIFEREERLTSEYIERYADILSKPRDGSPPPIYRHRLENNTTDEQLDRAIAHNDAITWYADELPMVFGLMGRYAKNGGSSVAEAKLLSYFDNSFAATTRLTRIPELVAAPCLSIVGTIQPAKLSEILSGRTSSGLFQRFLYVWPDRDDSDIQDYRMADTAEVAAVARMWDDEVDRIEGLPEATLQWSPAALKIYKAAKVGWLRQVRAHEVNDPDYASIINKMSIHLCRWSVVAAVLAGKSEIDGDVVDYARRCCDHFAANGKKVYDYITGRSETDRQPRTLTQGDIFRGLLARFPNVSQTSLARLLGISRQAVHDAIAKAEKTGNLTK